MKRILSLLLFISYVAHGASSQTTTTASVNAIPDSLVIPAKPGIYDEINVKGLRDEIDSLTYEQISDAAASKLQEGKSFVLACAITKDKSGTLLKPTCFDTEMFNKYLFAGQLTPSGAVAIEGLLNPANRMAILDVVYFQLSPELRDFSYLGSVNDFNTANADRIKRIITDSYTISISLETACNYLNTHKEELLTSRNSTVFAQAREYLERAIESDSNNNGCKQWALVLLARMYTNGWGVELNYQKANELFEQASIDESDKEAQAIALVVLANAHMYGFGVTKNLSMAHKLLQAVVTNNQIERPWTLAQAKMSLGYLVDVLRFPKYDMRKAQELYEEVIALKENPFIQAAAQMYLGRLQYSSGKYSKALVHLLTASEQTVNIRAQAQANMYLGDMYRLGYGVEKNLITALEYYNRINARLNLPEYETSIELIRTDLRAQIH